MSPKKESLEVTSSIRIDGYFWAEDDLFKRPITCHAKLVYLFLKRCADRDGHSFPSHQTIASAASMSRSQVKRSLGELCAEGLLGVVSRSSEGRSSVFIARSAKMGGVAPVEPGVVLPELGVALPGLGGSPTRATEGIPKEGIPNKEHPRKDMSGKPDVAPNGNGNGHHKPEYDLLAFLNKKTGKNFQPVEANLALIRSRLKEATVENIRAVIGVRCRKWGSDPKMSEYLRPATLFNREKFNQYLGELPATAFMTDSEAEAYDARMS